MPQGPSPETLLIAKRRLLQMHFETGLGHIGGNLSCLDILLTLYHGVMGPDDLFVLSKGHSAGALYITLWTVGRLTDRDLKTYNADGTLLSVHPPAAGLPDVVFATGSLGHGLGLAAGLALGKRLKRQAGRVFCLTSDGEWNEGSCWEALIFAAHNGLDNLVFVVDLNGMQGFGTTREVANLDPLADKFRVFGLDTREVPGHDPMQLQNVLRDSVPGPRAVVAQTSKGHGVSFMQDRWEWHYLPMSPDQYLKAVGEICGSCDTPSAQPC